MTPATRILRKRVQDIRDADSGQLALLYLEAIGRYSPEDIDVDEELREFLLDLVKDDCHALDVHCADVGLTQETL